MWAPNRLHWRWKHIGIRDCPTARRIPCQPKPTDRTGGIDHWWLGIPGRNQSSGTQPWCAHGVGYGTGVCDHSRGKLVGRRSQQTNCRRDGQGGIGVSGFRRLELRRCFSCFALARELVPLRATRHEMVVQAGDEKRD